MTRHLTLPVLLLACLASGFILRPTPVWALVFYLGVAPLAIRGLWRGPWPDWHDRRLQFMLLLIAYSVLTLVWGENPDGGRVPKFVLAGLCTTLFVLAVVTASAADPGFVRRVGWTLIIAGAVNSIISLLIYVAGGLDDSRLTGYAETRHSILGALIIGVCYVFALEHAFVERARRFLCTGAALLFLAFIFLTGSRGPMIAVSAASLVYLLHVDRRMQFMVVLPAIVTAGLAVMEWSSYSPAWLASLLQRGDSYRTEIWKYSLERIAERPIFGHGLAAYLGLPTFTFPHSLVLSTLFYTGIVGLLLLMIALGTTFLGLARADPISHHRRLFAALWIHALCGGLTELGQIVTEPSALWYIFWLPFGLSLAELQRDRGAASRRSGAEPGDVSLNASGIRRGR